MPEVFDMKDVLMLLVHLTNNSTHYINSLVVNSPERYVEVLHCFTSLFLQSKGALEQVNIAIGCVHISFNTYIISYPILPLHKQIPNDL